MKSRSGFSLIELLIVVAIILIIAAIAIPGLLRARMSANESAMVGDARTVMSAEVAYSARAGGGGDLTCLATPPACYTSLGPAPLLDTAIGRANIGVEKGGYTRAFNGDGTVPADGARRLVAHHAKYTYEGVPSGPGLTGQIAYCIDYTGLVCTDPAGAGFCAGATSILNCPAGQVLGR